MEESTKEQGETHSPDTLEEVLEAYPWEKEPILSPARYQNFFWRFEVDGTPEDYWPHLSDSSTLNLRMKLPKMELKEVDGKLVGKARYNGFMARWVEVPWEWEFARRIKYARVYSSGFSRYMRTVQLLKALPNNRTQIVIYYGWVLRSVLLTLPFKIGFAPIGKAYGKVFKEIEADLKANKEYHVEAEDVLSKAEQNHLEDIKKQLLGDDVNPEMLAKVVDYIKTTGEGELYRLRVFELAERWNMDGRELLGLFLKATKRGLFKLSWDVICPHCRGVQEEIEHLGEIPKEGNCDACDIDFKTSGADGFEVTFHIHPSVRKIEKVFFCSAEPAKKPHIRFQTELATGDRRLLKLAMHAGRYRMRIRGSKQYYILDLNTQGEGEPQVLEWDAVGGEIPDAAQVNSKMRILNTSPEPAVFVLEEAAEDKNVMRPRDLFNYQEFRDLFSEEGLAAGMNLDVGEQTLLFTDVVGSSQFYSEKGDSGAFEKVREHFMRIYEIIIENEGVLVKTMGDAVMASFDNPVLSLRAAIGLQKAFDEGNPTTLRLRISIHTGPCLAVNLNSNIDYFGNTVNLAAKLQATVDAGQVVFTAPLREKQGVDTLIKDLKTEKIGFKQKWNGETTLAYRVTVS